jgi:hypothetical protein
MEYYLHFMKNIFLENYDYKVIETQKEANKKC